MRKQYDMRVCCKCGKEYQPTGSRQTLCLECRPTQKERAAQWALDNPERVKANARRYYEENKEHVLMKNKKWFEDHPDKPMEYWRKYEGTHKELRSGRKKTPEQSAIADHLWAIRNPEKAMARNARRRTLGFIPMNQVFDGATPHHIDKERVIYIPKKLHRSIAHSIWTGKNMGKINAEAFNFLFKQEVVNALA